MKRVFISSAYTIGDVAVNVKRQMDMADELISLGFAPLAPLMSHFQHMAHPRPYEDWTRLDMEWLKVCDALLRLPGESKGADEEVALAVKLGIPVYHSIENLIKYFPLLPNSYRQNVVETEVEAR